MSNPFDTISAAATQPNDAQLYAAMEAKGLRNLVNTPVAGALGGAGLGILIQALRRRRGVDEDEQPSMLRGGVTGGLLGGLAGGVAGIPLAIDAPRRAWNETPYGKINPLRLSEYWSHLLTGDDVKLKASMKTSSIVKVAAALPELAYTVKKAEMDARLQSALLLGGLGGLGGLGIQGIRRLFQSDRDREENGAPSMLNGLLLGGLLGAGAGGGLAHLGGLHLPEGPSQEALAARNPGADIASNAGFKRPTAAQLAAEAPASITAAMAQGHPLINPVNPDKMALRGRMGGSAVSGAALREQAPDSLLAALSGGPESLNLLDPSKRRMSHFMSGAAGMPGGRSSSLSYADMQPNITPWSTFGQGYYDQ